MVFRRSSNWPRYFVPATIKRKIESQNALVGQERRDFTIRNALSQTLDDGGFANAGLADQNWIVLRAAAQDLDDAIDFAFPSNQGIELAVHRGLGQIAREFRQQRAFTLTLGLCLLLSGAGKLFTYCGKPQAALVQNLSGKALLFPQQPQQQMLGPDVTM